MIDSIFTTREEEKPYLSKQYLVSCGGSTAAKYNTPYCIQGPDGKSVG